MLAVTLIMDRYSGYDPTEFKPKLPTVKIQPATKFVKHQQSYDQQQLRKPVNHQQFRKSFKPHNLKPVNKE